MLSRYDLEFLKVVLEDLRYLENHWCNQQPSDEEIRRNTTVLRRLLVDNDLQKAWKLCGFSKEPRITIPKPSTSVNHPNLVYAQEAGANVGWGVIGQVRIYNKALSDDEIRTHYEHDRQTLNEPPASVGLKAFLDSQTIVVTGHKQTRREILQYAANKLGGPHFDKKNREQNLDSLRFQIRIADTDPVFLEVLSMAQFLIRSQDIQALKTKCEQMLSNY